MASILWHGVKALGVSRVLWWLGSLLVMNTNSNWFWFEAYHLNIPEERKCYCTVCFSISLWILINFIRQKDSLKNCCRKYNSLSHLREPVVLHKFRWTNVPTPLWGCIVAASDSNFWSQKQLSHIPKVQHLIKFPPMEDRGIYNVSCRELIYYLVQATPDGFLPDLRNTEKAELDGESLE